MKISRLTTGLAGALLGAVVALWWSGHGVENTGHGMSESPCASDGLPISGNRADDWAQLCVFHSDNARLRAAGAVPKAVLIGDSITARWPVRDNRIVNRGIAGQVSGQVLLRFQQDAIALKPEVIHILVGINDVTGKYGPESPDDLKNNIRAMVTLAKANAIPVIVGTIGPAQDVAWRPKVDRHLWVPTINEWLKGYAREESIVLADYHAVLSQHDGGMRRELFADTVHPNARGYAAMERVLTDAIAHAVCDGPTSD